MRDQTFPQRREPEDRTFPTTNTQGRRPAPPCALPQKWPSSRPLWLQHRWRKGRPRPHRVISVISRRSKSVCHCRHARGQGPGFGAFDLDDLKTALGALPEGVRSGHARAMDVALHRLLESVGRPAVCTAIEVTQGHRGFNKSTRGAMRASDVAGGMVGQARTACMRADAPRTAVAAAIKTSIPSKANRSPLTNARWFGLRSRRP